jgi:hypothetical protein
MQKQKRRDPEKKKKDGAKMPTDLSEKVPEIKDVLGDIDKLLANKQKNDEPEEREYCGC